ncbi:hypothetical protein FNV43_RR21040 [Rhamnella rubrinervis]|uniref:Uncharacterized protein n=1 Tax=Rhamnella rubrinervis TaxID=2594499 RepID=A0A8K0GTZ9_9ROSA|nr:hypothetical protein FNV43_RR21040 [Rhamnella rubrinervis]
MGHYNQEAPSGHDHDQVYPPPPPQSYPPQPQQRPHQAYHQGVAYVAPPPPIGYPTKDGPAGLNHNVPVETNTRGEGFWKGW